MKALVRSKKGRKSENCREGLPLDPPEMSGFLHNQYQTTRTTIIAAKTVHGYKNTCAAKLKKALLKSSS